MTEQERKKIYYEKNKEKILLIRKEKVKCECGCSVVRYNLARHKRTWSHYYFNGTLEEYNTL